MIFVYYLFHNMDKINVILLITFVCMDEHINMNFASEKNDIWTINIV